MKNFNYILISLIISCYSHAAIIDIPEDQPTIQAGIDVANAGDTILVQPGTYLENINYNDKNITVASLYLSTLDTAYISQTILDGNQNGSVVVFEQSEDSTAILTGFTIVNGRNTKGGGIYCVNASPLISNVVISNNSNQWSYSGTGGGGIYCENSSLTLCMAIIKDNTADFYYGISEESGGGICCKNSDISIQNVTIENNSAVSGGGIFCDNSNPILQNVIISNNIAYAQANPGWFAFWDSFGGGMSCVNGSNPVLLDVTIIDNTSTSGWSDDSSAYGGGIYCSSSSPELHNVIIKDNSVTGSMGGPGQENCGGGMYCTGSSPILQNVIVSNNSASSGGGIYSDDQSALGLHNVTLCSNYASSAGGGIYCSSSIFEFDSINRCNIYLNSAFSGNDLYCDTTMHVIVDTFTVIYPGEFHAKPIENYSFEILNGKIEQVDADLYVSPEGSNSNSGLTANEPLLNIEYAFSLIRADSLHQNTIHLMEGLYSYSSNEEVFPLNVPEYISLVGDLENSVTLDAEEQSSVLMIDLCEETLIKNLTITGGNGNGIYCDNASPTIENVTVSENLGNGILCVEGSSPLISNVHILANTDRGFVCESNSNAVLENSLIEHNTGGGILCSASSPFLQDVLISKNSAENGGGIYCNNSSPNLVNVTITGNIATAGGGIYCIANSNPVLELGSIMDNVAFEGGGFYCSSSTLMFDHINRCNIYQNNAYWGSDLYTDTMMQVVVDTFTVLYPTGYHANPIENFSFDILHGKIDQPDADLYISPSGDNSNSGLTTNDPLKTIHFAFSKIRTDSLNQNTIHLLEGTYSTSSNGEHFPINMFDFVSISGLSESAVVLDAEGLTNTIECYNTHGVRMEGLTVTGGQYYFDGCGIYLFNSSPILENVSIVDNGGTGISCNNSSPYIKESQISDNMGCGIICENNSNPLLKNVQISHNSERGIYCSYSSPVLLYVTVSGHSIASKNGGGIYCEDYSHPSLENVCISDNSVTGSTYGNSGRAGGFYCNNYSNPVLKNVLFSGNTAEETGGGMACFNNCNPVLINVTMSNNTSEETAGAFYNYISSHPIIVNSIFWNNLPNEIFSTNIIISWSDIQGGWEGVGNIDEDPLFTGLGDFPFALSDDSPCINQGNPDTTGLILPVTDLAGNPRFYGGYLDMGAYENQNVSTFINKKVYTDNIDLFCNPNPFTDELTISWEQTKSDFTKIEIYNSIGQRIEEAVNGIFSSGEHQFRWYSGDLPAGIYYIKIQVENEQAIKKIIKS